jgi:hypothetical protein
MSFLLIIFLFYRAITWLWAGLLSKEKGEICVKAPEAVKASDTFIMGRPGKEFMLMDLTKKNS